MKYLYDDCFCCCFCCCYVFLVFRTESEKGHNNMQICYDLYDHITALHSDYHNIGCELFAVRTVEKVFH